MPAVGSSQPLAKRPHARFRYHCNPPGMVSGNTVTSGTMAFHIDLLAPAVMRHIFAISTYGPSSARNRLF